MIVFCPFVQRIPMKVRRGKELTDYTQEDSHSLVIDIYEFLTKTFHHLMQGEGVEKQLWLT